MEQLVFNYLVRFVAALFLESSQNHGMRWARYQITMDTSCKTRGRLHLLGPSGLNLSGSTYLDLSLHK